MADIHETLVVFRRWRTRKDGRGVIALFPEQAEARMGCCVSYEHVGQHGSSDYDGVIARTTPAKGPDVEALRLELEGFGYRLKVRTRWNRGRTMGRD